MFHFYQSQRWLNAPLSAGSSLFSTFAIFLLVLFSASLNAQNPGICVKPDAGNPVTICTASTQLNAPSAGQNWSFLSSNNGATASISMGGLAANMNATGAYKFLLKSGQDATCSDTVTVTRANLVIRRLPDDVICPGTTVTFGFNGLTNVDYLWSTGAATATVSVKPTQTTQYTVAVTSRSSGCVVRDTAIITVSPKPNAGNDKVVCGNATTVAAAGQGETWSFLSFNNPSIPSETATASITQQGTISGLTKAGFYRFVLKNGATCEDTIRIQRRIITLSKINIEPACPGSSLTFGYDNTTDFTYSWSTGAQTARISVVPTQSTNYIVDVTETATGCTVKDTVKVTLKPAPDLVLVSSVCVENNLKYTTTITTTSGAVITANAGVVRGSGTSFTVTVGADTSQYTITATLNGCRKRLIVNKPDCSCPIIANPTVQGIAICIGTTATLTASGCAMGNTAKWYSDAGLSAQVGSGNSFLTPVLTQNTDYYVACVNDARPICKSSGLRVTVTIKAKPVFTNVVATCNQAGDRYDITFSVTAGATVTANGNAVSGNSVTGIVAGVKVVLVATLAGCKDSTDITKNCAVTTCTPPRPNGQGNSVCVGGSATISASGCNATYPLKWYSNVGLTNEITTGISGNNLTTGNLTTQTDYYAACVKDANCKSEAVKVTVTIKPLPVFRGVVATCALNNSTYSVNVSSTGTVIIKSPSAAQIVGSGPYVVSNVPAGTNLVLTATLNGCPKDTTITAPNCSCTPAIPVVLVANVGICEGSPIPTPTFTATVGVSTTVDWYATETGGTALSSNILTFTPTAAGTYYAQAKSTAPQCNSQINTTRVPVKLVITRRPIFRTTVQNPACQGITALNNGSVKITTATVGNRYRFNTTGFASLPTTATGSDTIKVLPTTIAQNIANSTPTATYYIRVFSNEGCSKDTSVTVVPGICGPNCPTITLVGAAADEACSGSLYLSLGAPMRVKTSVPSDSIRFVYFLAATGTPYSGGTLIGTRLPATSDSIATLGTNSRQLLPANTGSTPVTYYVYGIRKSFPAGTACLPPAALKTYTLNPLPKFSTDSIPACTGDSTYKVNVRIASSGSFKIVVGRGILSTGNGPSPGEVLQTINNAAGGGAVTQLTLKTTGDFIIFVTDSKGCTQIGSAPKPLFKACNNEKYDLALSKSISKKKAAIGDNITYTIKVWNEGQGRATGVSVRDALNAGVAYVSHTTAAGNYNPATKIWNIGDVPVRDTVTLVITVKVVAQGVWFNTAEICTMNEKDEDSTPCNENDNEDDLDRECFSVPISICTGEEIEVSVPERYGSVKWTKDNDANFTATGNTLLISKSGVYRFTALSGDCPAEGCCPIEVIVSDCCPPDICVPFIIKQTKKGSKSIK